MQIVRAIDRAQLRQFAEFPYAKYRFDPRWVPPLRRHEHARFDRASHPFYEHADMETFLALEGTTVVGRIAAIDDALHNQTHGDNLAGFGHFEADGPGAAAALLEEVERWARARGRTSIRGPLNPSLNESAGLLVEGFDEAPMVMMPYNPPAYAAYIEASGYRKVKDLYAWILDRDRRTDPKFADIAARARSRFGIDIRPVRARDLEAEIQRFGRLYAAAWANNWGFVPATATELRRLAEDLRPIADLDLVLFAEVGGAPAGCAIAIPDVNQALAGTDGRLWPRGWWRMLLRRRIIDQLRLPLMGVAPEFQRLGVHAVLLHELEQRIPSRYRRMELSWVLEDNVEVNTLAAAGGAVRYKTYRVYQKALA